MSYQLKGKVKVINDTIQVSEKFAKREFVITDEDAMYPQDIMFQLAQDNCSKIDGVNVGDSIEVSFNLRGREWTSPKGEVKYFNTLDAWRVEKAEGSITGQYTKQEAATTTSTNDQNDLPF